MTNPNRDVAILMGCFNGEKYILEQLDSISDQINCSWKLYISDDGSQDKTVDIVKKYYAKNNNINLLTGPRKGFAKNFQSLVCNEGINANYYAFSDQDDIWDNDKLDQALNFLETIDQDKPALFCSRTLLVDDSNKDIGLSYKFAKKKKFTNAIVQSIAGGNTMVFNNAARNIFKNIDIDADMVSHDWTMYMAVSGCDGIVFYDEKPSLRYRQHANNLIGMNSSLNAKYKRVKKLFKGEFKSWNKNNIILMESIFYLLSEDAKLTLEKFKILKNEENIIRRIKLFAEMKIYRQTFLGNVALVLAVIFRKI